MMTAGSLLRLIPVLPPLMLAGCGDGGRSDLEEYVQQVRSRAAKPIEPLPQIQQILSFAYEPGERRDPFATDKQIIELPVASKVNKLAPDPLRRKEELEGYALDTLRMVGTMEQNQARWGLIRTPNGAVHRVMIGNYMGSNDGRIVSISDEAIQLIEIVADAPGEWRERQAAIAISQKPVEGKP